MPALVIFASSVYMPSIPAMARDFGVTPQAVQHTITVYLAAMSLCALVVGSLSDRLGRRPVVLCTLTLFVLGGIVSTFAPDLTTLMLARLVQGIGASGSLVLARSMIRDALTDVEAAKASALVSMTMTLAPMMAPLVGGVVQQAVGWRANLGGVSAVAVVVWITAIAQLGETLPADRRHRLGGARMALNYFTLLGDARYLTFVLPIACGGLALFAYQTAAPVLLIGVLHVPPAEFGLYAAAPAAGFLVGTFLTTRLAARVPRGSLIQTGCMLYLAGGGLMLAAALLIPASAFAIAVPMVVLGFGNGLVAPSASIGSMSVAPLLVGTAAALTTCMRMGAGSLGSWIVTTLPQRSALPLAALLCMAGALACLSWGCLGRRARA